jgi:hypothetical protein
LVRPVTTNGDVLPDVDWPPGAVNVEVEGDTTTKAVLPVGLLVSVTAVLTWLFPGVTPVMTSLLLEIVLSGVAVPRAPGMLFPTAFVATMVKV